MNSSNSFNICPRCDSANELNAQYCSRCGGPLKIPDQPVECPQCHSRNTPMAEFCRSCGAPLKGDAQTTQQTSSEANTAASTASTDEQSSETAKMRKAKKVYNTKGGRGWAIGAIVMILLFAYYVMAPFVITVGGKDITVRPEFLVNIDIGFIGIKGQPEFSAYGYNYIETMIDWAKDIANGATFGEAVETLGAGNIMILVLTIAFVIAAFTHLVISIVRLCAGKRSKHANWTFLALAIVSTLIVGLLAVFHYAPMPKSMSAFASWFYLSNGDSQGVNLGYAIWAIPLYYWVFFGYSFGAKAKQLQELG